MQLASLRAPAAVRVALPARPRRLERRLTVQANTLWSLKPDRQWCSSNPEMCKRVGPVDLTGAIGSHRLCSLGSGDMPSEEAIDFTILEQGGIHVVFEAEGASKPLDSPSELYCTDIDSKCDVVVDGTKLSKGERKRVKPGARVKLGEVCYEVERNVFAHA